MELWDLYDEQRDLVATDHVRGEAMPDGTYHIAVHIWIKNSEGKFLISRRSASREEHPLLWECQGGSILKGEDSLSGAIREVREEVGVELDPASARLFHTSLKKGDPFRNGFLDAYTFGYDGDVDLKRATTDEVSEVRWLTREEIGALYDEGKFVPGLAYFFTHPEI